MRYLFSFPYAAMALFLLLYLGCKKGDDISNNPNTAFPLGKWKISYYFKKSDKTALYASYVFDFERRTTDRSPWQQYLERLLVYRLRR
jgi:hypothetical protein